VVPSRDDFCYLTTTGRRTGRPHEIEIWYAHADDPDTLYLLAGGGESSDWVRNLVADAACTVRLGSRDAPAHDARGRILATTGTDAQRARTSVFDKFQARYDGDLTTWRERALPVALDLDLRP
jgi:deazaflavin-dependent oxidoreductase (nitroreductase family)